MRLHTCELRPRLALWQNVVGFKIQTPKEYWSVGMKCRKITSTLTRSIFDSFNMTEQTGLIDEHANGFNGMT